MRFLKYLGCLTVVFLCLTGCGAAKGTPVSTATSPAAETPAPGGGNHRSGQEDRHSGSEDHFLQCFV